MFAEDYEEFTPAQKKVLGRYVTNTSSHIFVLRNLPEVIKGALFSRYSRSTLGLRSLLLKEFISNDEESFFANIVGGTISDEEGAEGDQAVAIKKAQTFYDRILDGYGDDSIGELGGAHLAVENVTMIAAKMIEDCRIGGSPLEKSTRYIYFDQKVNGEYLFYREPVLMTSAYRDLYLHTCTHLFETYSKLIPPLTEIMQERMPQEPGSSTGAYKAALRAKVLDCLRGLLPAGTLTNLGLYGNGRFFQNLIHKLNCENLAELHEIGTGMRRELSKVIPSFIRRADPQHKSQIEYSAFHEKNEADLQRITKQFAPNISESRAGVRLLHADPDGVERVAAALLFKRSKATLYDLIAHCKTLSEEDLSTILESASSARTNRRHKSPRALEHATFTFEIVGDYGVYRDLHRHRMLTQERQWLSCDYDYYIPPELLGTELEDEYRAALTKAKVAYDTIATELPEEAQYIVPMAYNIRWYFHINLRALQWLTELRSQPQGHPQYRLVAQEMGRQVMEAFPQFKRFLTFIDFEGHSLGRLAQEENKAAKSNTSCMT